MRQDCRPGHREGKPRLRMPVQTPGLAARIAPSRSKGDPAMAKGMNKRKEVKKPKKEAAKPAVSVASSNAKVTINPGKPKD
jgi:hypothetical protein